MIKVAVPKGRLFKESVDLLLNAGIIPQKIEEGRKLTVELGNVTLLLVKPFDVPVYVENGVADLGICGYDVYLERRPDVYRLLDLGIGRCRISVAGKPESEGRYWESSYLKVATKYVRIAEEFFSSKGVKTQIIPLSGSVELAPLIGLADYILDLVQTGRTLRENGLIELEEVESSTAWLVCNRASFRNKARDIKDFVNRLTSEPVR